MKILGVETSTAINSVAVLSGGKVLSEITQNNGATQSALLALNIKKALESASLKFEELDGLAVSIGPGSFTALRVGVSYAKGLAFATKKNITGVPSLDALSCRYFEGIKKVSEAYGSVSKDRLVCPMGDARKNEVYFSAYTEGENGEILKLLPESSASIEKVLGVVSGLGAKNIVFQGEGAVKYSADIKRILGSCVLAPDPKRMPSAVSVAELGAAMLDRGEAQEFGSLLPLYIRKSDAELGIR